MKQQISIKSLLTSEERKVAEIVAELEASQVEPRPILWTERLSPNTRGGKTCW